MLATNVYAVAASAKGCENDSDLLLLNSKIENIKNEINHLHARHAWRNSIKSQLQLTLQRLESKQRKKVDQLYVQGCASFHNRASIEARIERLEKNSLSNQP